MSKELMNSPRVIDAAKRYAAADRSDPFAYSRAMSHIQNGIAGFTQNGQDAIYDAEPMEVDRVVKFGNKEIKFKVTEYKNVKRP